MVDSNSSEVFCRHITHISPYSNCTSTWHTKSPLGRTTPRDLEGIVTTIGSAKSHKDILANPDLMSKRVLEKGLDAGTSFEILSIDIADVDVGENIGAKLQAEQAEADKRVAQALAEKRRAMAVAEEQENVATIAANRAKLVLAEAEVPKAIADAFRSGNLGVMDYYRLKNLQADTSMRESIGDEGDGHADDNVE